MSKSVDVKLEAGQYWYYEAGARLHVATYSEYLFWQELQSTRSQLAEAQRQLREVSDKLNREIESADFAKRDHKAERDELTAALEKVQAQNEGLKATMLEIAEYWNGGSESAIEAAHQTAYLAQEAYDKTMSSQPPSAPQAERGSEQSCVLWDEKTMGQG